MKQIEDYNKQEWNTLREFGQSAKSVRKQVFFIALLALVVAMCILLSYFLCN